MKNIFKTLAAAAMLTVGGTVSADSVLYWMLQDNFASGLRDTYSYAKVAVVQADGGGTVTYLTVYPGSSSEQFSGELTWGQYAQIGSTVLNDNYKYFVELFNNSGEQIGLSNYLAYSDISSHIGSDSAIIGSAAVFTGVHIPEPTSGLLALLGFGLLALRRKQKNA